MRVFVTGANGFVGQWLVRELAAHGHSVVETPGPDLLDIGDSGAVAEWLGGSNGPVDAIAHLAGMAFAPDAGRDPGEAFRVNVGGTVALFEALRRLQIRPRVLVTGSADVYGLPDQSLLPLVEDAPLAPNQPYGLSKVAQEAVAAEAATRYGFHVVATRSFNHTGPGQRPVFVVPAMAARIMAVRRGEASAIRVGNVDVKRDLTDVRDVVAAYRLLLEAGEAVTAGKFLIVNIASGRSVSVRSLIDRMCQMAGVEPVLEVDPSLLRPRDAVDVRGDASLVHKLTGWSPTIPLDQTLADVLSSI